MKNKKVSFGSGLLVLLTLILVGIVSTVHFLESPLNSKADTFIYTLNPGTPAKAMVNDLQKQGMLSPLQARLFSLILYFKDTEKSLKAGEYQFTYNMTPEELFKKLMKGDIYYHSFRVPEGRTFVEALNILWQDAAVEKSLKLQSPQEILAKICNNCTSAEGLLFPDTYFFKAKTTDVALLQRALKTMDNHLQKAWNERDPNIVLKNPYEVLILASILEKEASLIPERALMSGVFQQRIAKKMRLQADPTVIYGLGESFNGNLTTADLRKDTPYNTYVHLGLPPTPIALPSLPSIEAACHPTKTDKLYFVAKGDGSHYFSATLDEHNKAVEKYQKLSENKK